MDLGSMISGIANWLGDNPSVLIFVLGFAVGYFVAKR